VDPNPTLDPSRSRETGFLVTCSCPTLRVGIYRKPDFAGDSRKRNSARPMDHFRKPDFGSFRVAVCALAKLGSPRPAKA
jgi:hypothetical protein